MKIPEADKPWVKRPIEGLHLIPIREEPDHVQILYELLAERTPEQSISHKAMPTPQQHADFVAHHPYRVWYLVKDGPEVVGCVYLTRTHKEIGVTIFNAYQGRGYGNFAVIDMMRRWRTDGKPFLANINPANDASKALFTKLGFRLLQETYTMEAPPV